MGSRGKVGPRAFVTALASPPRQAMNVTYNVDIVTGMVVKSNIT